MTVGLRHDEDTNWVSNRRQGARDPDRIGGQSGVVDIDLRRRTLVGVGLVNGPTQRVGATVVTGAGDEEVRKQSAILQGFEGRTKTPRTGGRVALPEIH